MRKQHKHSLIYTKLFNVISFGKSAVNRIGLGCEKCIEIQMTRLFNIPEFK